MGWLRSAWNWTKRIWSNYVAPAWSGRPGQPKIVVLIDEIKDLLRRLKELLAELFAGPEEAFAYKATA